MARPRTRRRLHPSDTEPERPAAVRVPRQPVTASAAVAALQQSPRLAAQRAAVQALQASPALRAQALQLQVIQRVASETRLVPPSPASVAQMDPNTWGYTEDERIRVNWHPQRESDGLYHVKLDTITGDYSLQAQLLAGVNEVTGPGGNTTQPNHASQIGGLGSLGDTCPGDPWYMVAAVQAHEHVHETSLATALAVEKNNIEGLFAGITAPGGLSPSVAKAQMAALPAFAAALQAGRDQWDAQYVNRIDADHTGRTPSAERRVVNPMIAAIRGEARKQHW